MKAKKKVKKKVKKKEVDKTQMQLPTYNILPADSCYACYLVRHARSNFQYFRRCQDCLWRDRHR